MKIKNSNSVNKAILKDSIFIIGKVSSVEGRRVKVEVKKDKNLSHILYDGQIVKNVSVGSYVKITKGFISIVGKVEGEYISKEIGNDQKYERDERRISRFLDIVLFGNFEGDKFIQGIKEMPLIDNECYLLDKTEFNSLHQFHSKNEPTIKIGVLTEQPNQDIRLSVSKLFASHIGVFGNTGSGKSNTLASIITALFELKKKANRFYINSKFVVIDFNGEYIKDDLITRNKEVYNLTTYNNKGDKYYIEKSNIETIEIISVLLEATEKTQKPFLNRALKNDWFDKKFSKRSTESVEKLLKDILRKADPQLQVNIFSEIFDLIGKIESSRTSKSIIKNILKIIETGDLKYHSQSSAYYIGNTYSNSDLTGLYNKAFPNIDKLQISDSNFGLIKFKIFVQYFYEVINGYSVPEHIRPLIGRMIKKFDVLQKLITIDPRQKRKHSNLEIINLSYANLEMKKTLPLIISKQLYDEHKQQGNFEDNSLHIIIDEAHNILSSTSQRESETWKDYRLETFEEIIKEGRKFSTFLTISSQRPFDISSTIISQLHNYFIHRLINNNDINAIQKTVAYLDKLSFESIPLLGVGSCFVAGLSSDIPIKVTIDLLPDNKQPKSETINFKKAWFDEEE